MRRAVAEWRGANRKRAVGSRLAVQRTVALQKLQTPSKRTTGRGSVIGVSGAFARGRPGARLWRVIPRGNNNLAVRVTPGLRPGGRHTGGNRKRRQYEPRAERTTSKAFSCSAAPAARSRAALSRTRCPADGGPVLVGEDWHQLGNPTVGRVHRPVPETRRGISCGTADAKRVMNRPRGEGQARCPGGGRGAQAREAHRRRNGPARPCRRDGVRAVSAARTLYAGRKGH